MEGNEGKFIQKSMNLNVNVILKTIQTSGEGPSITPFIAPARHTLPLGGSDPYTMHSLGAGDAAWPIVGRLWQDLLDRGWGWETALHVGQAQGQGWARGVSPWAWRAGSLAAAPVSTPTRPGSQAVWGSVQSCTSVSSCSRAGASSWGTQRTIGMVTGFGENKKTPLQKGPK